MDILSVSSSLSLKNQADLIFRFPLCGPIHVQNSEQTLTGGQWRSQSEAEQHVVVAAVAADEEMWQQRVSSSDALARSEAF
jgi:hypothetical protein